MARIFLSLQERDFLMLWLSSLGSFLAMNMQMVARGYLAYELEGSATALGIVMLAWGFPQLALSLVGGVVADRVSKRNLLIMSQATMGLTTVVNAVLISLNMIQLWHLVVLGLVQGAVFAFNIPARQALIPAIVGRDRLANAVALNNTAVNLTRVVGPAVAGAIIAFPSLGTAGAFYFMGISYLFCLLMLFQLPADRGASEIRKGPMAQEILAGLRYIRDHASLVGLLTTALVVVCLAMPYQTLMPLFAVEVYDVGAPGLGLLNSAGGLGALAGSLALGYFSAWAGTSRPQVASAVLFGLSLVLFAFSPWFPMALVAMFLVGATGNAYLGLNSTLIMQSSNTAMHGRVMSVYMLTWGFMPVTSMPISMLADTIGAPVTVAAAGALTAVVVLALNGFGGARTPDREPAAGPPGG